MSLLSSLTQWFFRSMLFSSHIHVDFPAFFFLLITNSIPLWSEKMGWLHLLVSVIWSVLGSVPRALAWGVCSAAGGWDVLLSVKFIWLKSHLVPPFAWWFSVWAICPSQSGYWSPPLLQQFPPIHGFAFHVFLNSFNHSMPFDWWIQPFYIRLLICKDSLLPSHWLLSGCFVFSLFFFLLSCLCKLGVFHGGVLCFPFLCIRSVDLCLWLPWGWHMTGTTAHFVSSLASFTCKGYLFYSFLFLTSQFTFYAIC